MIAVFANYLEGLVAEKRYLSLEPRKLQCILRVLQAKNVKILKTNNNKMQACRSRPSYECGKVEGINGIYEDIPK